ncbi:hypothetical protein [Hyphococcus luteus]|uniref:hypothetical protein n=1 Tax=Hyphococcus luteus TaxID=2058213 RepID=UPI001056EBD8|nr:hypothetical protein [Marinicaulis flavus]
MKDGNNIQDKVKAWVKAFEDLRQGKRDVKCPECGVGEMALQNIEHNGQIVEVRIYCSEDPTHENYVRL